MSLVTHRCWCSIEHAIPEALDRTARELGQTVYCPLGHQWIIGESDLVKERRKRQQLEQENARLADVARIAESDKRAAEADAVKARMQVVRHKKRSAAGLCPCCNRSFVGLSRHMKTKHPQYAA